MERRMYRWNDGDRGLCRCFVDSNGRDSGKLSGVASDTDDRLEDGVNMGGSKRVIYGGPETVTRRAEMPEGVMK